MGKPVGCIHRNVWMLQRECRLFVRVADKRFGRDVLDARDDAAALQRLANKRLLSARPTAACVRSSALIGLMFDNKHGVFQFGSLT